MWIPTHYVVLLVAILLLESAALFAYTLIGLIKQNPLPWLIPPQHHDSDYQYGLQQSNQIVRGSPQPPSINQGVPDANVAQEFIAVETSTSVILQTALVDGNGATIVPAWSQVQATRDPDNLAVIATAGATSTNKVSLSSTMPPNFASTRSQTASSSEQAPSSAPASTVTLSDPGPSTMGSVSTTTAGPLSNDNGSRSSQASAGSSSQTKNLVTSNPVSTTTVPASAPPRSTSTTVVVVPPPGR